jgi:hypothetical protein
MQRRQRQRRQVLLPLLLLLQEQPRPMNLSPQQHRGQSRSFPPPSPASLLLPPPLPRTSLSPPCLFAPDSSALPHPPSYMYGYVSGTWIEPAADNARQGADHQIIKSSVKCARQAADSSDGQASTQYALKDLCEETAPDLDVTDSCAQELPAVGCDHLEPATRS